MRIAAGICFAAGVLTMFGTQTFIPDSFVIPGYLAVFFLFVAGVYLTYSSEL